MVMQLFAVLRHRVAPRFTAVETGAVGRRDFATSLLEPIGD